MRVNFEEKLGDTMREIKSLTLDNQELKNKNSEAEKSVDKISKDYSLYQHQQLRVNCISAEDTGCPHLACFLRQPSYPSPSPRQKILHNPPPSNIRLLPRTVHSY